MKSLSYSLTGQSGKPPQDPRTWKAPIPRQPAFAAPGRLRKIAMLGGADTTLQYAPWHDLSWELWSHSSCRHRCVREPDRLFDVHPETLWRNPEKKTWDRSYVAWLAQNHIPIYMQEHYKDVPASIRYPFETMITEFPRGYMTNQLAYMIALALLEGVTHIAPYGCHYSSSSEYGPQRGCAEYWLGVAEGRGVQVLIPPLCDLLNKPHLLYGYQSHPEGKRDPSYSFCLGPRELLTPAEQKAQAAQQAKAKGLPEPTESAPAEIIPLKDGGDRFPLMKLPDGEQPALERANVFDPVELIRLHKAALSLTTPSETTPA